MSSFRDTSEALLDDLLANVPALSGAQTYATEPLWYPPQDPSLAIWFDYEEVLDEGPTGARHLQEYYWLRYWESAPFDEQQVTPDPDESLALENLYEAVRLRFFQVATQSFAGASPLWVIRGRTGLGSVHEGAFTRGIELYFWVRRFRPFVD